MSKKLLVHIITGVENPTRASLGLLVARSALEDDYEVDVFVAGDGVSMLRPSSAEQMQGVGIGLVADHLDALKKGNAGLYASGLSAKARGLEGEELIDLGFKPSPPNVLVDLTFKADRTLIY